MVVLPEPTIVTIPNEFTVTIFTSFDSYNMLVSVLLLVASKLKEVSPKVFKTGLVAFVEEIDFSAPKSHFFAD